MITKLTVALWKWGSDCVKGKSEKETGFSHFPFPVFGETGKWAIILFCFLTSARFLATKHVVILPLNNFLMVVHVLYLNDSSSSCPDGIWVYVVLHLLTMSDWTSSFQRKKKSPYSSCFSLLVWVYVVIQYQCVLHQCSIESTT